jgi:hypothetical protein
MSTRDFIAVDRSTSRSIACSLTSRLRSALVAFSVMLLLPSDSQAQQCLGRPQRGRSLLLGAALEDAGRTRLVAPRIGVSAGRANVNVGAGVRSGYGLSRNARVYQAELAVSLNSPTNRAHWCVLLRADRQHGPDVDFVGGAIRAREHGYEASLAFGESLGGTAADPSPYILSGRFGLRRGTVSDGSSLSESSESNVGIIVGVGFSVIVRPWLSTGVHGRAALVVPGSASRTLGIDVSAVLF